MIFCNKCGVKSAHESKFCSNCGTLLPRLQNGIALEQADLQGDFGISKRQLTVLFCDLVGSTSMAEKMDAEELFDALAAYHTMVKRIAVRFNGHVAKIVGDGVDLYFGYPIAGEDDAVRAIYAALAITEEIKYLRNGTGKLLDLKVRVGIATGRVTVGMLDTLSIAGAAPNLAARIQAEAQPGQVALSPSTRRIAGAQFVYEELGTFALKGFSDDVKIYTVTKAFEKTSRSAWRGRDNTLPMSGRDTELAQITASWQHAQQANCAGTLLLAEAGMGKSRIATAFAGSLHDEPHLTVRLQCSPFHTNSVLYPFVQHLMTASGFTRHDSVLVQIEKLEAQMAIVGITQAQDLALIASLLDIKIEGRYPALQMPPPAKLAMTGEVLIRYFAELVRQVPLSSSEKVFMHYFKSMSTSKPLLIVFEDMHWIDPSSMELLDKLLSKGHLSHTLVLMTARPSFQHVFSDATLVSTIELQKLSSDATRQMVTNLCESVALPESAVALILKKTDGIPLYIEEMTHMVQDAQRLPAVGAADLGIPDTLLDLLMERLDRLGSAKKIAQVAAVLGQSFSQDLLASVAQVDVVTFTDELDSILDSGLLIKVGDEQLQFKHALVENAAYDSILLKNRVALHSRVVACLTGEYAALAQGAPELLAYHLTRANRALEASRYLLQAGIQSLQNGAPREAAEHLKEGLTSLTDVEASPGKSETELGLLSVLGPTTMVLTGPGSAAFGGVQQRAFALCHSLPGKPRQFPITYGLCLYHWGRAEFDAAQPLAQQLLDAANNLINDEQLINGVNPDEALMAACNMNGMIAFHKGQSELARMLLQKSVDLYLPDRDAALYPVYMMDFGVFGRFYLALACFVCGDADTAQRHAQDALALAQKLNQPHSMGFALMANMNIAVLRNEPAIVLQFAEQAVPFASQFGFPEFIAMGRIARGWASAKLGQYAIGLEDLEAGFGLWKMTGFENWQSWFTSLKSEILILMNRGDEARADIQNQLLRIEHNGEMQFKPQLVAQLERLDRASSTVI
jgi:class 3 adenylate cyclase/tetratricopeptide (TPR) repeat protein